MPLTRACCWDQTHPPPTNLGERGITVIRRIANKYFKFQQSLLFYFVVRVREVVLTIGFPFYDPFKLGKMLRFNCTIQ